MKKILVGIMLVLMSPQVAWAAVANPQVDMDRDGVVAEGDALLFQDIYEQINNGIWSWEFYAADFNHDGVVNIQGLAMLGSSWGQVVTQCHWADVNGDGEVTREDLRYFRDNFGPITKDTNRLDINGDAYVDILDVAVAGAQFGAVCE